jgi:hypothetical protein
MENEQDWIGIDAIAFHGPECYVDMASWPTHAGWIQPSTSAVWGN